MSEHRANIIWDRQGAVFTDGRYSRAHRWSFDGGIEVPASSSPEVVPVPLSTAGAVDPEEAFVASLASCHMLFFLSSAAKRGFLVDRYQDQAVGVVKADSSGCLAVTLVTLRPEARFVGDKRPTAEDVISMHEWAHEQCLIARSVKAEVRCEPTGSTTEHSSVEP